MINFFTIDYFFFYLGTVLVYNVLCVGTVSAFEHIYILNKLDLEI